MGTRPAGGARAAAVRTAQAVAARRIQQLKDQEERLSGVLADYFEAKAHGEKIRNEAQERAARLTQAAEQRAEKLKHDAQVASEKVTEQAERDAADYDAQVAAAVRQLLELGETKASIAEMTGLSQAVVRAMAREHADHPAGQAHNQNTRTAAGKSA